jgi:hypothetical protein
MESFPGGVFEEKCVMAIFYPCGRLTLRGFF